RTGIPVADVILLYRTNSSAARLYSLVVDPVHRGSGLAGQLLDAAEAAACNRGSKVIRLEVRPENRDARELYARRGYAEFGQIARFYEDGATALRLQKH